MKVEVSHELKISAKWVDEIKKRGRFFTATIFKEMSVGVHSFAVPSLNPFIAPGTNARRYDDIEVLGVVLHARLQEQDSSLHSACLITVNTSSH